MMSFLANTPCQLDCVSGNVPALLLEPAACLSWAEGSFLASMSQSPSSQGTDMLGPDVFNQLLEMLDQSAFHTVQPIELLNFSEGATVNSPSNTIQISMDCITMHDSDDHLAPQGNYLEQHLPPCGFELWAFSSVTLKEGDGGGGIETKREPRTWHQITWRNVTKMCFFCQTLTQHEVVTEH
ncbi:tumor protein 63 isoform X1 [Tachysurus ichikawai]